MGRKKGGKNKKSVAKLDKKSKKATKLDKKSKRVAKVDKKSFKVDKKVKGPRGKPSKLSPAELAKKHFKKEFNKQANYFKFLKQVGNLATKDFKAAKKALKNGNDAVAKKIIAKYTLLNIDDWVVLVKKKK